MVTEIRLEFETNNGKVSASVNRTTDGSGNIRYALNINDARGGTLYVQLDAAQTGELAESLRSIGDGAR